MLPNFTKADTNTGRNGDSAPVQHQGDDQLKGGYVYSSAVQRIDSDTISSSDGNAAEMKRAGEDGQVIHAY